MSYADKLFIDMCSDIIENGYSTEGEKVRPKWPDGTYAYTIKKFGVVNRYDLSKEFPAITLRKTYIRSAIDEILWIWQKKSNNVHDLSSHIWDEWADEDGSIGKAYGYQLGKKHKYKEGEMDHTPAPRPAFQRWRGRPPHHSPPECRSRHGSSKAAMRPPVPQSACHWPEWQPTGQQRNRQQRMHRSLRRWRCCCWSSRTGSERRRRP